MLKGGGELPHRLRRDAQASRDLPIRHALRFQASHELLARTRQASAPRGISVGPAQGGESPDVEPALMSADASPRTSEGPGDLLLRRPALLHEVHHRVGFGHPVGDGVLRQDDARDDDDAKAMRRAEETAIVDDDGAIAVDRFREERPLSLRSRHGKSMAVGAGTSPSKKADRFGSPSSPARDQ